MTESPLGVAHSIERSFCLGRHQMETGRSKASHDGFSKYGIREHDGVRRRHNADLGARSRTRQWKDNPEAPCRALPALDCCDTLLSITFYKHSETDQLQVRVGIRGEHNGPLISPA
jgi:hypothetical protein